MSYVPPLRDIGFVIHELLDAPRVLARMEPFETIDADLVDHFAAEVLAPLNTVGDKAGCSCLDGKVLTSPGFAEAYRRFRELGWPVLACDPAYGGDGLPQLLNAVLYKMLDRCALAWVWIWSARVAAERRSSGDDRHAAKLTTARYYFAFLLPETAQSLRVIRSSGILVGDAALYQA